MLRYLILVTENLIVTAITVGMLFAFINELGNRTGKTILLGGSLLGIAGAAAMAVIKNTTAKIHTGMWNLRVFAVFTAGVILFLIFTIKPMLRKAPLGAAISAAVIAFTSIFYTFPDVMAYPFSFNLNGASVLSTAFFTRFIGWLAGWIVALMAFLAVKYLCKKISQNLLCGILDIVLIITAIQRVIRGLDTLRATRVITDKAIAHNIFVAAKFTTNNSNLFIYAVLLLTLVIPVTLYLRSYKITKPYKNSAEKRKLLAENFRNRRWSVINVLCYIVTVLCMTWFTFLSTQTVELSPIEDALIKDDAVWVSFEQVADGHLHRFAWTSENGVQIRFIVIKKPNSSSYGIGLDACDICGETGYYEKNGKIVCKLCDVVMNINTIGFKGGCNPKVIDYKIENGYIIVPTYTLLEHEKDFKS